MNIDKIKKIDTKYFGKEIEYYKQIESTHIYAKQIAKKEENNGKVIISEAQTKGIGTKGRKWHTGINKNIAMTIILNQRINAGEIEGLTLKIAQVVKSTIKEIYGYELKIKEPNDLLLNNKKICGILTEIRTIGEEISYLLISMGFNANEEEFTQTTKEIGTSLKKEYGKTFEREEIISNILINLEKEMEI